MSGAATVLVALGVAVVIVDLAASSRIGPRVAPRLARKAGGSDGPVRGPLAGMLAGLVRVYRAVGSARVGAVCRFEPSCSAYALEAVHQYGGVRGGLLAGRRLLRCHPLSSGGYDPVPPRRPHSRHNDMTDEARATPVTSAGSRS